MDPWLWNLADLRGAAGAPGGRLYLGLEAGLPVLGAPSHAALVLGPPRSGKTTTLAVPNVLAAAGPAVVTSTKPEVMTATAAFRAQFGRCWLLDPTGSVQAPAEVSRIRWSAVAASGSWDQALLVTRAMTNVARPAGRLGEAGHWTERAEALLASLFHAAALSGAEMSEVCRWVLRHDLNQARTVLATCGASVAEDVLTGISATEGRELSGIFSTAAGVLAAYRSEAALETAGPANFSPERLAQSTDTVYVCAPSSHQDLVAPIVVGFLEQVRAGAYWAHWRGWQGPPLVAVLDEAANIAPIPDLPALVAEGGGQGLLVMAFFQDLSQARLRWGASAEGFMSLFGAKLALPGIGDLQTLELLSRLSGETDVWVASRTEGPGWWGATSSLTWSPSRQRRIPFEAVSQLPSGQGLLMAGPRPPTLVELPPYWAVGPLRQATQQTLGPAALDRVARAASSEAGFAPARHIAPPDTRGLGF